MADQFGALTQQDLLPSGDGRKLHGWYAYGTSSASAIDVNISNAGNLTVTLATAGTLTFVYSVVTGDFDVNTYLISRGSPANVTVCGIDATPDVSAAQVNSVQIRFQRTSIENWEAVHYTNGSATNDITGAVAGNYYYRMSRAGNVFTLYSSTDGSSWTQRAQWTRSDMPAILQLGLLVAKSHANAYTAQFDYFQGTYTLAAIRSSSISRCAITESCNNCRPMALGDMTGVCYPNYLPEGPFVGTLFIGNAIASTFLNAIIAVLSEQCVQHVKHPFVPEILFYCVTEIAEGFNATRTISTKIVDSGIEALRAIRSSIDPAPSTQSMLLTISEGLSLPQHISTNIVDSGIEALQAIRTSAIGINAGQYQVGEIIEGLTKALSLVGSMSEGINSAQYLTNETAAYTTLTQYIKMILSEAAVKYINSAWDLRLYGVSVKKYTVSVDLTKRESEAIPQIEIALAGLSLFEKCNPIDGHGMERIELVIAGETYRFLMESREFSETYDKSGLTIGGRQKTGLLAEGFAHKLTQTYSDNRPSSVTVIMGNGDRAAEDINNDLIYGENQAKIVAETYLDDNFYRKKKYKLDVPHIGCQTGQIASITDDRHNVYGVGIIREASLSLKLSGSAVEIKGSIELYCYEEDGLL